MMLAQTTFVTAAIPLPAIAFQNDLRGWETCLRGKGAAAPLLAGEAMANGNSYRFAFAGRG